MALSREHGSFSAASVVWLGLFSIHNRDCLYNKDMSAEGGVLYLAGTSLFLLKSINRHTT